MLLCDDIIYSVLDTHFLKNFNWKIIALQNFVVFCHTSTRISHRYTHVSSLPSPSPHHPSACWWAPIWVPWVIQQMPIGYLFYTWYCKFLCYYLPYISPSPSSPPILSIDLFSMSVSPLLPWKWIHQCQPFRFHIYVSVYNIYISLSDLLQSVSLALVPSTSLEQIQMHSFLWLSSIPLYVCTTASLSIYPRCQWTSRLRPCSSYCK